MTPLRLLPFWPKKKRLTDTYLLDRHITGAMGAMGAMTGSSGLGLPPPSDAEAQLQEP